MRYNLIVISLMIFLISFVSAQNLIIVSDSGSELADAQSIQTNFNQFNFDVLKISQINKDDLNNGTIIFLYNHFVLVRPYSLNDSNYKDFAKLSESLKEKGYYVPLGSSSYCPWKEVDGKMVAGGVNECFPTGFGHQENLISGTSSEILFKALSQVYPEYNKAQIYINQDARGLVSINGEWNPIILRNGTITLDYYSGVGRDVEGGGTTGGYPSETDSDFFIGEISILQMNISENHENQIPTYETVYKTNINLPANSTSLIALPKDIRLGDNFYLQMILYQHLVNEKGVISEKAISPDYLGRVGPFSIYASHLTCTDYGSYVVSEDKIGGIKIEKSDKCISNDALLDAYCTNDNKTAYRGVDCLSCVKNTCTVGQQTQINEPSQNSNETESSIVQINQDSNECENIGLVYNKKYCSIGKT